MEISKTAGIVVDAGEFFKDEAFLAWLNDKATPKATWHEGGLAHPFSDAFVLVDPSLNGEGSDSDMPEHIWREIVEACILEIVPGSTSGNHIIVWLRNDN